LEQPGTPATQRRARAVERSDARVLTNDDVTRAKLGIGEEAEQHEHIVDVGRDENDDSQTE
jgi:hypothetical protein